MVSILFLVVCLLTVGAQLLPPGTTDVPAPRAGDCDGKGPATYVSRISQRKPDKFYPEACSGLGGAQVYFNDPCAWAHGQAQMTMAHFNQACKGATRTIHWHNGADEWGFVKKGQVEAFVASPDSLPWPNSVNVLGPRGVWYFPSGWLHGLMCLTPEEEGGCEFYIAFASPQAAEPNGHNLDRTFAQAPDNAVASAMGINASDATKLRPAFAAAATGETPIVTMVEPSYCEPKCPPVTETMAAPAGIDATKVEQQVSIADGVVLHQIRQAQFPFSRTMSQERTELAPGALRPMVWVTADAILIVVSGKIVVGLEGGIPGGESAKNFVNETLAEGDIAYFPNARAYWFQEATGKEKAETVTVFNVGNWRSIEMGQAFRLMPLAPALSNLHLNHTASSLFPQAPILV